MIPLLVVVGLWVLAKIPVFGEGEGIVFVVGGVIGVVA